MAFAGSPRPFAVDLLSSGTISSEDGSSTNLAHNIDTDECRFIADIIQRDPAISKTLEVGCAYGIGSLVICWETQSRPGAHHLALDPFQKAFFKNCGIAHLQKAGLGHFELLEEYSEFALPRLAQRDAGTYDLVFIDGWHTFDHTLLDMYYANRLLRVGGVMIVDDCTLPGVAKAVAYVTGYPAYRVIDEPPWNRLSWKRQGLG